SLWESVDVYMGWIDSQLSFLSFNLNSKTLIYLFLATYFFSGIVVGFLIIRTLKLLQQIEISEKNFELNTDLSELRFPRKKKKKAILFIILLIAVLLPIIYFNNDSEGW